MKGALRCSDHSDDEDARLEAELEDRMTRLGDLLDVGRQEREQDVRFPNLPTLKLLLCSARPCRPSSHLLPKHACHP